MSVRFNTVRMDQKISRALSVVAGGDGILQRYDQAADEANKIVSQRITASGRGGEHNSEFAHQDKRVFRARSDRINISVGWLNPSAHAHERGSGGKLWYQYQDSGFFMFGGERWIDGVGATIDRRENLIDRIYEINREYLADIERAFR